MSTPSASFPWAIPAAAPEPGAAMDLGEGAPTTPERKSLGTGGGLGGTVKLRVLDHSGLGTNYCGSLFGSKGVKKVCVNVNCGFKTHAAPTSKFGFGGGVPSLVFIEAGPSVVYAFPHVEPVKFGSNLGRYLIEERQLAGWQVLLESLEQQPSISAEEVELLGEATKNPEAGLPIYTPWKRRKIDFIEPSPSEKEESFEDITYVGIAEDLGPTSEIQQTFLPSQWKVLHGDLQLLRQQILMARKGNRALDEFIKEAFDSFENKLLHYKSLLGTRSAAAGTESAFSLLSSQGKEIEELRDAMADVHVKFQSLVTTVGSLKSLPSRAPSPPVDLSVFKADMITGIEQALLPLRNFFLVFTTSPTATPGDLLSQELGQIKSDIQALKSSIGKAPTSQIPVFSWGGAAAPAPTPFSMSASAVPLVGGSSGAGADAIKLARLERRVTELENQMDSDSVSMGGVVFSCKADVAAFLKAHVTAKGAHTYFTDAHGLLALAVGAGNNTNEVLRMQEQMRKLGYSSIEEALVAASFGFAVPVYFGKTAAAGSQASSKVLMGLKSHQDWDLGDADRGMSHDMLTAVGVAVDTLNVGMDTYLTSLPRTVAVSMLNDSKTFVKSISEWMTKFYRTQVDKGASAAETWAHVSHSVREVWNMLHKARRHGRGPFLTDEDRAVGILWGSLQAHAVMKELMSAQFVAHVRLSHILNLHLRDNSVMKSDFELLKAKVLALTSELAAAKSAADKAINLCKGIKK